MIHTVSAFAARTCTTLRLGLALLLMASPGAFAAEPNVPPAPAPDGVAVAILGPGVDYRVAALKGRLARDGEGELISWDFSDGDTRPFEDAAEGRGTPLALDVLRTSEKAILVIVREKPGDPNAFGHMMSFVAKTPARIVVWPDADPARPDWPILVEAARRFVGHLFIVPRRPGAAPGPFAPLAASTNVILLEPAGPDHVAEPDRVSPLFAVAGRAADALAADPSRAIAAIAADLRRIPANATRTWQPAVTPAPQ